MRQLIMAGFVSLAMSSGFSTCVAAEESAQVMYEKAMGEMVGSMDASHKDEFMQFMASYSSYNAVRHVRDSVMTGIQSCGLQNPDLKEALDTEFVDWNGKISDALKKARLVLDNTVKVQRFAPVSDVRGFMSKADAASEAQEKKLNEIEIPVSDKEACLYLLDSMSDTEETLLKLMGETFGLERFDAKQAPATAE